MTSTYNDAILIAIQEHLQTKRIKTDFGIGNLTLYYHKYHDHDSPHSRYAGHITHHNHITDDLEPHNIHLCPYDRTGFQTIPINDPDLLTKITNHIIPP